MLLFTTRNAVMESLSQVGVIVFGALAAGISRKAFELAPLPVPTTVLLDYGVLLFTVPLVWVSVILWLRLQIKISEWTKRLAFASGLALLMLLTAVVGDAVALPWLGVDWSLGGARNAW